MLLSRNLYRHFQGLQEKEKSQKGWNEQHGYFHKPRRSMKYLSRGKMWARKTFGRHPNNSFLKGHKVAVG